MSDVTLKYGFQTQSVHAGESRPGLEGAVGMPIFQNSTYEYTGAKSYQEVRYTRLSNTPNHLALGLKLAALEKTQSAMVMASGMAAISTALLATIEKGGHLLAQSTDFLIGRFEVHALRSGAGPFSISFAVG